MWNRKTFNFLLLTLLLCYIIILFLQSSQEESLSTLMQSTEKFWTAQLLTRYGLTSKDSNPMAKVLPLYRASQGLNTFVDPRRVQYSAETGLVDLQASWNVILDATGRIGRRKGYDLLQAGEFHSMFSAGQYALAVEIVGSDAELVAIDRLGNTDTLRALDYPNRMAYVRDGKRAYYSNGFENGYIEDMVDNAWLAGTYTGRDSTKTVVDPPAGQLMEIAFGRMWIAKGNVVHVSEPNAYNWFDYAKSMIPFWKRITMLRAVSDGMYISDENEIYFAAGTNPEAMQLIPVADYPAILGSVAVDMVTGLRLGLRENSKYLVFGTKKGLCVAGPSGEFYNLTEERITYPEVSRGSVLIRDENFLFLFDD